MINHNLLSGAKVIRLTWDGTNYVVAAGVDGAVVLSNEIDCLGFNALMIVASIGVIAANGVFTSRVKFSDTSGTYGSGTVDRVGADLANNADTDDNKLYIHDIYSIPRRYAKFESQRTVGNCTCDTLFAILYHANDAPVTQQTTVGGVEASQILNCPTPSAT